MKLHLARPGAGNVFTSYGSGYVVINEQRYERSLVVMPDRLWTDWAATSFEALTSDHIAMLAGLDAEVTLLGTGGQLRFPSPALLRSMAGKGLEIMDVQAACRTYNILVSEGRQAAAALLLG